MVKLYQIIICEDEGWVTQKPLDFKVEIEEYSRELNKNIDINKTIEEIEKLNAGEEFEAEELKFKCIEMDMEKYSDLPEWGGW